MSKIYIGDHLGAHKTTIQLEKWFAKKGHEVHWDTYYEWAKGPNGEPPPSWADWADIFIFEWLEGQTEIALKAFGGKKPIYARVMDIEIWANNAAGADWSKLNGLAYTSKYMYKVADELHNFKQYPNLKIEHIPLSIDMSEWTFKDRKAGYNIAVIGDMWDSKGPNLIPQFCHQLIQKTGNNKWKFFVQGGWRHDVWKWYWEYENHIIKELGLQNNIFLHEERVSDMNQWLEDKNFLVTFSHKDAFSLIVGEAMAKGIKALPHNFPGSKDIWGKYVWSTFDELFNMITNSFYDSEQYYEFVKSHYSNEVVLPKWEKLIGI